MSIKIKIDPNLPNVSSVTWSELSMWNIKIPGLIFEWKCGLYAKKVLLSVI